MNWRRFSILFAGFIALLLATQNSEAGSHKGIDGPGSALILKAGDYDALTFVEPAFTNTGRRDPATATFDVSYGGFAPEEDVSAYSAFVPGGSASSPNCHQLGRSHCPGQQPRRLH